MIIKRRLFLKTGAAAGIAAGISRTPNPVLASTRLPDIKDSFYRELTDRAIDSAMSAGATYVDVRLTHTRTRRFPGYGADSEVITAGVRAMVHGKWGFASSPLWDSDELTRLGLEAATQAAGYSFGLPREADLAEAPPVSGHWETPVKSDPFDILHDEASDYFGGLAHYMRRLNVSSIWALGASARNQSKVFASSTGSYITQIIRHISPAIVFEIRGAGMGNLIDSLNPTAAGFEVFTDNPIRDEISKEIERVKSDGKLPQKPVDVGRFPVVLDARSVAHLVSSTIGAASELDRVLGYEANAGGTSYLNDPEAMIDSFKVGNELLNISANRTEPGSTGTVKWDDEGIETHQFELVTSGILKDFSTNRETAGWIRDIYLEKGKPLHSHACSFAPEALDIPLSHTPNLRMSPGNGNADFSSLLEVMEDGIAFFRFSAFTDYQHITGMLMHNMLESSVFEIRKGKKVARLVNASALFRTPELWNSIKITGGPESLRRYGMAGSKGEPPQVGNHSVTSCPVLFTEMSVIDPTRKA